MLCILSEVIYLLYLIRFVAFGYDLQTLNLIFVHLKPSVCLGTAITQTVSASELCKQGYPYALSRHRTEVENIFMWVIHKRV